MFILRCQSFLTMTHDRPTCHQIDHSSLSLYQMARKNCTKIKNRAKIWNAANVLNEQEKHKKNRMHQNAVAKYTQ